MTDTLTCIDPVKYLMDAALEVLTRKRRDFRKAELSHQIEVLEGYKRVTLQKLLQPSGYYLWIMVVHREVLSIPMPLQAQANLSYNPLKVLN